MLNLICLWLSLNFASTPIPQKNEATYESLKDYHLIELMYSNQFDSAEKYIIAQLRRPLDKNQKIYYLCNLSHIAHIVNNFELAEQSALEALACLNVDTPADLKAFAEIQIMTCRFYKNDFQNTPSEINKTKESLHPEVTQKLNLLTGLYFNYNGGYEKAIPHITESLNLLKNTSNYHQQTISTYYLAISYFGNSKIDSAFYYLNYGLKIAEDNQDTLALIKGLNALTQLNLLLKKDKEFLNHISESLALKKGDNYKNLGPFEYVQLMNYYLLKNEFEKALEYGKKAEKQLNQNHFLNEDFHQLMFKIYYQINDFKSSLFHFQKFSQSKLSSENSKSKTYISKLNLENDLIEKELTIKNQQFKLSQEYNRRIILIGMNGFFLFTILVYFLYLKKKKENQSSFFLKEKRTEELVELEKYKLSIPYLRLQQSNPESKDHRIELFIEIINLLENEKIYLDPELKQNTLITKLQTNKKYFYEAINNNSKLNFNQLVNFYRLQHVKKTIEEHCLIYKNVNLPQNYFLNSGFNTIASYYRIFKENIGLAPIEYAKEFLKSQKAGKPKVEIEIEE